MQVTRLRLSNYRNYTSLDFVPAPGANVLVGGNAQGKTNVLEALALLSTSKSPRTRRDAEMVRLNAEMAHVTAEVHRDNANDLALDVVLVSPEAAQTGSLKTVRINGVKHPRAVDLLGQLQTVGFWPDDVDVVRGEPSGRRRFINAALCQLSPQYCFHLAQYRRVLEQRNRLLKLIRARGGYDSGDSLNAWNEQLIHYGARVIQRRVSFVVDLHDRARAAHLELTGGNEDLGLTYQPSVPLDGGTLEGIQEHFAQRLAVVQADEFIRGITLAGPHRDDVLFTLDATDARTYGSLGQQRSVALSLRVAELRLVEEDAGEPCVVLMDEILAELDDDRARRLVDLTMSGRQSFITSTHTRRFPHGFLNDATVWAVRDATVAPA